jgi:hypothetical protein
MFIKKYLVSVFKSTDLRALRITIMFILLQNEAHKHICVWNIELLTT